MGVLCKEKGQGHMGPQTELHEKWGRGTRTSAKRVEEWLHGLGTDPTRLGRDVTVVTLQPSPWRG